MWYISDKFIIDMVWRLIFFQGVPGNGKFTSTTELVDTLTPIIFLSTVENAAVNLPVYDECAFIPNYPMILRGQPPTSKVCSILFYQPCNDHSHYHLYFQSAIWIVKWSRSSLFNTGYGLFDWGHYGSPNNWCIFSIQCSAKSICKKYVNTQNATIN